MSHSSNPANFANLPKDELRKIAAKGGHTSHGAHHEDSNSSHATRNPDGTFTKGSELAKELGAQGGHASHGANHSSSSHPDRNPDGTFTKGSELARELGAQGGHAAHEHAEHGEDSGVS